VTIRALLNASQHMGQSAIDMSTGTSVASIFYDVLIAYHKK
jgi:hypothetical protein